VSQLDEIEARLAKAAPGAITITPSDVHYLLTLARKQADALEAVRGLHQPVMEYEQPVGCSECDWDAIYPRQQWPCPTLSALKEPQP